MKGWPRRSSDWKKCFVERDIAYIGIGSNIGNRLSHCRQAIGEIRQFPGSAVTAVSSFYDTEPLEMPDQDWFMNAVIALNTGFSPLELLDRCQTIEESLGRKRLIRYGPRTIDLDLLFYGQRVMKTDRLILPHPKLHQRRFVLTPLAEIAPDLLHPIIKKSMAELLNQVPDHHSVRRLPAPEVAS